MTSLRRRWSQLSRVELVDVYTRQSLYLLLWGLCGLIQVSAAAESDNTGETVAALIGAATVTALGSWTMAAVFDLYPARRPLPWLRVGSLLAASAVYLLAVGLPADGPTRGAVVFVVVATITASIGGVPDNRITAVLFVVGGALFGASGHKPSNVVAGVVVAAAAVFSVRVSLWLYGIVAELDSARHAQTRLAVAEERLRFSRDVHDVLGRRLSTIAVQSELAAALAERGDSRAAAQMLEVRGVAHEALREARGLARGYRPIELANELDGARSLLRSAGIGAEIDVEVVPRGWHEAAGWVVRESVTNVLRHSDARLVRITFAGGTLRIVNDGVKPGSGDSEGGTGLPGLRERLAALGATLDAEGRDDQWTVVATLTGTGPLSAGREHPG